MDTVYVPSTQALMTPLSTVKQEVCGALQALIKLLPDLTDILQDVSSPNSDSLITQKDGELERVSLPDLSPAY